MRVRNIILLLFNLRTVAVQETFEPADFNVTQALLDNGVDAAKLPQLAENSTMNACAVACQSLEVIFGENKVEKQDEPGYGAAVNYFWSVQQREPQPFCVFRPEQALDVSTLVLLSRLTQCPFAVRSGGHAAFAGASSINGGITVVFDRMKHIGLSRDQKIASIEPGNLWLDIYTTLAEDNLAVVGGRVSDIGIGGLTTGGGVSFFSNEYGWACDNVASFEVVTARGAIVTASSSSLSDLYWALRGGGNNFGIVTKFNLETFPHGPQMFGGSRLFLNTSFPAAIDAFVNLAVKSAQAPKAAQYLAIALDPATSTRIAVAQLEYADPIIDAPIFDEYRNIPAISDTTQLRTLANITQLLNASNPKGYRETYWTASSKLDRAMVEFVLDVSFEEYENIQDVPGVGPATVFQAITVPQLEQMQKKGGNALGLTPADGPLLMINLASRWERAEDDERVIQANANIVSRMKDEARRRGLANDFLYMNYASQYQDVVASYGKSAERLREIAKKYDPTAVFQKLQPGYFKLNGPPVGSS
ncbi:hypothetical protein ACN47E_002821 [Coniothyrium glycines]